LPALLTRILPLLCILACASAPVAATPVLLKEAGLSSGLAVGSLKLPVSSSPQNYFSGLQQIQIDNGASWLAYCIDPFQWSSASNSVYDQSSDFAGFLGAKAGAVAKLYSLFYSSTLGNNLNAAGFQLALWEVIADSTQNLAAGNVATTAGTNAAIKSSAQAMLDALAGPAGSQQFVFTLYTSASNQDFLVATLTANQVPEPQAWLLCAGALAAMLLVRRQRRS
ncbi:MAG TPA: hypothetical protein VN028_09755, partial [Rhodocyclaceae bacterium]|nr:hypothetical protein [Rhodocyclaceae bacterium]